MSLKVAGLNRNNQLTTKSNSKSSIGDPPLPIIYPCQNADLDATNLNSFSVYSDHSVWVDREGVGYACGSNNGLRIINTLPNKVLQKAAKIELKDNSDNEYRLRSAVCGYKYTLYLTEPLSSEASPRIAYVHKSRNNGKPLFIDLPNRKPVAIFGGSKNAAAIDDKGFIYLITKDIFKTARNDQVNAKPFYLPQAQKCISIACCKDFLVALSETGKVYMSSSNDEKDLTNLAEIPALKGISVHSISGTCDHCFAVATDGRVFAYGSNQCGQLGFGRKNKIVDKADTFTEINSENFNKKPVVEAYAGSGHSFFRTKDGTLLSCGCNTCGQLLLTEPDRTFKFAPMEVPVRVSVNFCVLGNANTSIFINCDAPRYSPNVTIPGSAILKAIDVGEDGVIEQLRKQLLTAQTAQQVAAKENRSLKEELELKNAEIEKLQAKVTALEQQVETLETDKVASAQAMTELEKKQKKLPAKSSSETPRVATKPIEIVELDSLSTLNNLKELGNGNMAKVVKVSRDEFLSLRIFEPAVVAKKGKEGTIDSKKMKKFLEHYEKIHQLCHPNIAQVEGFCYGNGELGASMLFKYYPSTLQSSFKKLSEAQKVGVIYEIVDAMKEVHKLGLVHRNLKPSNILLDADKHVKISDFASSELVKVAKQTNSDERTAEQFPYLPPELLGDNEKCNEKADVFSFGVIMYNILNRGKFPKVNPAELEDGKKCPIPKKLTKPARELLLRCFAINPDNRPSFEEIQEYIKDSQFNLVEGIEEAQEELQQFLGL